VWVALERNVGWGEIERWSRHEGEMEKFEVFRKKFEGNYQPREKMKEQDGGRL